MKVTKISYALLSAMMLAGAVAPSVSTLAATSSELSSIPGDNSHELSTLEDDPILDAGLKVLEDEFNLVRLESGEFDASHLMEFDTIEDFEAFLLAQREDMYKTRVGIDDEEGSPVRYKSTTTKHSVLYNDAFSKLTGYVRYSKSSSGVLSNISVWDNWSGATFPISWKTVKNYYSLSSSKKSGTAHFTGDKVYGVSVGGNPIGYSQYHNYTMKF